MNITHECSEYVLEFRERFIESLGYVEANLELATSIITQIACGIHFMVHWINCLRLLVSVCGWIWLLIVKENAPEIAVPHQLSNVELLQGFELVKGGLRYQHEAIGCADLDFFWKLRFLVLLIVLEVLIFHSQCCLFSQKIEIIENLAFLEHSWSVLRYCMKLLLNKTQMAIVWCEHFAAEFQEL